MLEPKVVLAVWIMLLVSEGEFTVGGYWKFTQRSHLRVLK